jgi:hypothetical protein
VVEIREFLHYDLTEATPDHSSLSVMRQRLDGPVCEQVFTLVLAALSEHGLLRGKNLGIDSPVLEANASLRGLVNRNTGEAYWDYLKRLAAESGINPQDSATAIRQFLAARSLLSWAVSLVGEWGIPALTCCNLWLRSL